MKRSIALCLALSIFLLTGCVSSFTQKSEETKAIHAGEYHLNLVCRNGHWELEILCGEKILYENAAPAIIRTVTSGAATVQTNAAPYASVTMQEDALVCIAVVRTEKGSAFQVEDRYCVQNKAFLVERSVSVTNASGEEKGFASVYSLQDADGGTTEDYEYFIPSILYKDTACLSSNAIMSSLGEDSYIKEHYVKETRCGTPLAMLRGKAGYSVSLVHVDPQISAETKKFQKSFAIDNAQQYGSIGYSIYEDAVSIDFVYPSTETPTSYETGSIVRRYHSVEKETRQQYTIGIVLTRTELYNDAMVRTFLEALSLSDPNIAEEDLNKAYADNMELYHKLYVRYENEETGRYSSGLPFAVNVKDFDDFYAVSFQMGFIGCQTAIGAELIRDGYLHQNDKSLQKGKEILDFWSSDYVYTDVLPPSWWQPSEDSNAGASTGYPSFLRCFVDGAEGLLNGCIYAKEAGIDYKHWATAAVKIADFLVENQNDDGSFYRAYNTDGTVCTDTSSPAYQGTSKLNTPVAVRFLCHMYDYTGDLRYYDAARGAVDYCYYELYLNMGKYVGGTPDNPNVPDKEAAVYAMYAFSAAYDMTKDDKYYAALEHAAVSAMSWVYTYDFAVPFALIPLYDDLNIFKEGNTAGWSVIATGHSAIDTFGATAYYELFKLYLQSGNESYLKVAGLLQNNTKKAMDLEGEWDYLYSGFCLEACNVADQVFHTAENGVWLPWISAAFMEPMIRMEDTFGNYDMYALLLTYSISELQEMID